MVKTASMCAALAAVAGAACGSVEPCEAPNGPCIEIEPSDDDYVRIQGALIDARPGDVIFLHEGDYQLELGLSLTVDGVTLRGAGKDRTVLSFAGQIDGAQGLLVTADDFSIEELAVEDPAGDAVKVEGAVNVAFRGVRAEWTRGADSENGAYGLYPVQCENVLIERSVAIGASDAGIYVGQSRNIVVRDSRAELNVAGIEIENSIDADVYDNVATNNTGGVLVFNLPGLQIANGAGTRVFGNEIVENNTPNFAPPGNIVGKVPQGTGFAAIAGHQIEVFDNEIADNQTSNSAVVGYEITLLDFDDPDYDPHSDTVYFHDNRYRGGGQQPVNELGFVLVQALVNVLDTPIVVPDIVFDGHMAEDKMQGGMLAPQFNICLRNNGDADFAFLDAPNDYVGAHLNPEPFDCEHAPLAPVSLPESML